jgi:RNA polymerase sigma-70 factor (ECF subfamily)
MMGNLNPFGDFKKEESNGKVVDVEAMIRKTFEADPQAGIEMIYRHYYKVLCSHAVRYVGSKAIAEDLVSDILFEFHTKELFSSISTSYRAYLFTSVRNRAYDHVREEMRHGNTEIENAMSVSVKYSEQPDSITQFEELHHLIENTINAMPLKRKQVYIMHRYEGKKSREIAEELQLSQRTIEAHIYKAITQVHAALKEHWLLSIFIFSQHDFFITTW